MSGGNRRAPIAPRASLCLSLSHSADPAVHLSSLSSLFSPALARSRTLLYLIEFQFRSFLHCLGSLLRREPGMTLSAPKDKPAAETRCFIFLSFSRCGAIVSFKSSFESPRVNSSTTILSGE